MTTPHIDLEGLADGLNGQFWTWFTAYKDQEWGVGGARYAHAVRTAAEKQDAEAVLMLRCVIFAQTEIERLFAYPPQLRQSMIAQARQELQSGGASRRGPGL